MRPPTRRKILAGLGGIAACAALRGADAAFGQPGTALSLRLGLAEAALRGTLPPSPIWDFIGGPLPQLTQGDVLDLTLANDLPIPVALNWRGGDGAAAFEPLAIHPPLAPGQSSTFSMLMRQAGTVLCDARLLGDAQPKALPAIGLRVAERQALTVDATHLVTIADWRVRPDGSVAAPGTDPAGAAPVFTVNGQPTIELAARANSRLRLCFVNACQRSAIALKLDDVEMRVMAIDGQPAEPFVARGGQVLLAAGTRIDTFVDLTTRPGTTSAIWLHDGISPRPIGRLTCENTDPLRPAPHAAPPPLPGNGLPERIPLTAAHRVELSLDAGPEAKLDDWRRPIDLAAAAPPAFRAKRGATVVLTVANPAPTATTFHLHGHHVRWLDRLDDGWKPFWLDTLLVPGGQTIRAAFLAEHPGAWLLETMGTDWAAPRLARWYVVD
jgi:FtsP/CotA-like multicopper oxidase with cupredoxin domain